MSFTWCVLPVEELFSGAFSVLFEIDEVFFELVELCSCEEFFFSGAELFVDCSTKVWFYLTSGTVVLAF